MLESERVFLKSTFHLGKYSYCQYFFKISNIIKRHSFWFCFDLGIINKPIYLGLPAINVHNDQNKAE